MFPQKKQFVHERHEKHERFKGVDLFRAFRGARQVFFVEKSLFLKWYQNYLFIFPAWSLANCQATRPEREPRCNAQRNASARACSTCLALQPKCPNQCATISR